MILESAQLLASAHWVTNPEGTKDVPEMYRLTHKNHPCAVWVRQSIKSLPLRSRPYGGAQ